MKLTKRAVLGTILLVGLTAWAQEFPRAEVGANYSYARFAPSAPYSQGHSINGGGGSAVININEYLGIKMDLQGFGSTQTTFNIPANSNFPNGVHGRTEGNLFTYLFGPELKIRAHGFQPYGHLLFGGAHSNVYADAYQTICQPIVGGCAFSKAPAGDAFAMEIGGGVDIPINKYVSFRPAEVDWLMTRFTNPFSGTGNQHNFRYSAGILFSFGHTTY